MTFTENWFGQSSQQVLAGLVAEIADVDGRIIEIGSWEGRSTVVLANSTSRTIHAVDTWKGCAADETGRLAAARDVHAAWQANIATATAGNVVEHRMDWRDYHDNSPVALLFIDAEHTYREVIDTIDAYLPLMAPGAVMCGDDASHPPVWQAVTERFPDAERAAAMWIVRFPR